MSTLAPTTSPLTEGTAKSPGIPIRSLRPSLPSQNPRYNHSVQPKSGLRLFEQIPARTRIATLAAETRYPRDWTEYTTPEGDRYFWHESRLIVTPIDLRRPGAVLQVQFTYEYLVQAYGGVGDLPACEVYINSSTADGDMEYYFIDPATQQPFWAEDVKTIDMGIYPFDSFGFLKSALTPEYWTHVDYFPMHRHIEEKDEDELLAILRHGCIDGMTSPGSTSPYSAEECRQYINVLEGCQAKKIRSGYRTASFARIWSAVARTRHINAYGLDAPRLDRLQGLDQYYASQTRISLKLSLSELVTFHISRRTFHRMTALWNGRVVYQRHWEVFWNDMREEWIRVCGLSGIIFLAATIVLATGRGNPAIASSASSAAASAFIAAYLHQTHSASQLGTGPEISNYVMKMEDLQHGLRPLALMFTAPQALTIYSLLFLTGGLLTKGLEAVSDPTQIMLVTAAWCLPFLAIAPFLSRF